MSIIDLYIDYNIETAPEGHKHYRDGWLNIECPHCTGSQGYHLGFNTDGNYFYCWRCGAHPVFKTLMKLLSISYKISFGLAHDYNIYKSTRRSNDNAKILRISKAPFKYPLGVWKMDRVHRRYLEKRGFDPNYIEDEFGVLGTSPISTLDGIPYKYRILVPIFWDDKVVSFQCRDYTNRQEMKYMTCPQEREIIHHKHILYGKHWGEVGICVEGVFDVWRLRGYASATLGIGYTNEQVRVISQLFKKVYIIFDPESQARTAAEKLKEELKFRGVIAYNYTELKSDPADLSQDDADHLLTELKLVSGGGL